MKESITLHDVYAETRADMPCTPFTFAGGEPHVTLNPDAIDGRYLWVDARVGSADGFLRTLAVLDAVRGCNPRRLGLFMPYFPGARQDRRVPGTPFTLKLYTDAIKRAAPDVVVVMDPHSDVLAACLDVRMLPLAVAMPPRCYETPLAGWICPDAGAEKRVYAAAQSLGVRTIVHARKHREPTTGRLSGFSIDDLPTAGRYVVVDDICDGGGTFNGLAAAARQKRPDITLDLWVTHGIFSQGLDALLEHYTDIFTTDSFPFTAQHARLHAMDVHPFAAGIMRRTIGQ